MRFVMAIVVALGATGWLHGAEEYLQRTAYLFRTDGKLVRVSIPVSPPSELEYVEPVVVADLSSSCISLGSGSTRSFDGRILTLSGWNNRLCVLDPITGDTEMLSTLPVAVWPDDDLVLSPDGHLVFTSSGSSAGSMFSSLDPDTGQLVELGLVTPPCTTVELHQGTYYASCWVGFFWKIDPQNFESTQIGWSSPFDHTHITGLSSTGDELWYVTENYYWPSQGNLAMIGTIDPVTAERTPYVLIQAGWPDAFAFLEVYEQVTTAPVPGLQPVGVVVLTILLAVAAVLTVRRV